MGVPGFVGVDGGVEQGFLGPLGFLGGFERSWIPGVTWSQVICMKRWDNSREELQGEAKVMGF